MRLKIQWILLLLAILPGEMVAACTTTINVFPYVESFEAGPSNWTTGGTASDWAWGAPSKPTINSAGDGINCWITGGLSAPQYNPGQRSWLQSPCFDFTNLVNPEIRFQIFWETEYQYDGGNLQYSIDNGINWQTLGSASNDGCVSTNWYDIASITNLSGLASPSAGWSGTVQPTSGSCRGGNGSGGWLTARYCLRNLAGLPSVAFRFTFGSGTTCNGFDGIAIDLFKVQEVTPILTSFNYECQSSRTVVFSDNQPDCRSGRLWDFGDGMVETNSAPVISHTFLSEGDYVITLSADHTCRGAEVTVMTIHLLSFNAEIVPPTCNSGGSIVIQPIPAGLANTVLTWQDPTLSGFAIMDADPGLYPFQLTADLSCAITDSLIMPLVAGIPDPDLGPDRSFCPAANTPLRPDGAFTSYLWSDGSTDSTLFPPQEGLYWVEVSDQNGCSATDSVMLEVDCMTEPLFPSAFTPNGDQLNDQFRIVAGEELVQFWAIYDRWGQLIFQSDSGSELWAGERIPEGVYVCRVVYQDLTGQSVEKIGRVTLIR